MRLMPWTALLALVIGIAATKPTEGQLASTLWKKVGGWEITYSTLANVSSCIATTFYDGGTTVILFPGENALILTVMHERWKSVEEGRSYPVSVSFDGRPSSGVAFGRNYDQVRGIDLHLTAKGASYFMTASNMSLTYKGESVARLNLSGTYAATLELKNCQDAKKPGTWPYYSDGDPFRR